ncbi:MAG: glycosyltransferase [Balneolaceae bacterium]|nr:glycosyltransferase [Balneolaceae bacterium]MCH8547448.1 glycosyltransferase [Balneolaceae bacterium]
MKKVVMVAPYFPPRRRVGAQRPFRFVAGLPSFGWEPIVVTLSRSGKLTEQESELLRDIKIINVRTPFDRTIQPGSGQSHNLSKPSVKSAGGRVADWIDRQIPADTWLPLFMISLGRVRKQLAPLKPDAIWSTGDPWSSHWLGQKLAKSLNLPWVADFRDPWTLASVNLRRRSSFSEWADRKLEASVLKKAGRIVFTANQTRQCYEHIYPEISERSRVIYNTSGIYDLEKEGNANLSKDSDKLNLLFFGTFRRLSPVQSIADVLEELGKTDRSLPEKVVIHSFGQPDREQLDYIREKGLSGQFRFHDKVLPEEGVSILKQADLLLLSSHPERDLIIPAKLWDYLASGKPILSLLANPEAGEIIGSYDAGVHFGANRSEEAANFLMKSIQENETDLESAQSETDSVRNGLKEIHKANHTTYQLAELLNEITR